MNIECRNLRKEYPTLNGGVLALEDVSFAASGTEIVCLVGPSGCGKTTVLKMIANLIRPTSGEVAFPGASNGHAPRCALVFQEHGLFPWKTVLENAAFGLECLGWDRRERRRRAGEFLETVGLGAFARNYPHELSVGMRQRANIARAFIADPQVLLMDEPFGSLDAQMKVVLQEELLRMWKEDRKLVIYVTHDIREAILLGDRILVMSARPGRIREEIRVPIERPRSLSILERKEAVEIEHRVWDLLREEMRQHVD